MALYNRTSLKLPAPVIDRLKALAHRANAGKKVEDRDLSWQDAARSIIAKGLHNAEQMVAETPAKAAGR